MTEIREINRRFYDRLWSQVRLIEAQRFNTWPIVAELLRSAPRRLEVAPGLRPRLPLTGTDFADQSVPALQCLRARGAWVAGACVTALPYADASFDLVAAFDIVEHVAEDEAALMELSRVLKLGGSLLLSMPLHPSRWTAFDDMVGHHRRYTLEELVAKLSTAGLEVERSAAFGMQPRAGFWLDLGTWYLTHQRERALWWYDRVFLPLAVRFQPALQLSAGLIELDQVDEVLLLCRRR